MGLETEERLETEIVDLIRLAPVHRALAAFRHSRQLIKSNAKQFTSRYFVNESVDSKAVNGLLKRLKDVEDKLKKALDSCIQQPWLTL